MPKFYPVTQRRWAQFKANKRGYWSFWIFLTLMLVVLFADVIANDKPLLVEYKGSYYSPVLKTYPETVFGGEFETEADYRDPFVIDSIQKDGWMVWPLIKYSYDTINYDLPEPAPSRPTLDNMLDTDDQGRDVTARVIHGFRISVLFGLALTLVSSLVGAALGGAGVKDRLAPVWRQGGAMASRKLLQWANSKSVGRTTEIAVMAPIKKGCVPGERRTYEERVRDVVANLAGRIERGIPQELGRVPTIHMARIFVIRPEQYLLNSRVDGVDYYDTKPIGAPGENANVPKPVEDVAVDGEDPAELGDRFRSWLMTLVIFDADLKPYMREVAAFLALDFDRVFENCEDFDTTARWETFWQWVRRYPGTRRLPPRSRIRSCFLSSTAWSNYPQPRRPWSRMFLDAFLFKDHVKGQLA